MDQQQQSRWWPTGTQILWMGISAVGLFAAIVVFGGYYFEWKWTGFPKRTPWDWVDLLIVPLVLALGGYLFTRSENRATRVATEQRAQDEALQAYLDQMGQMLLDKERPLRQSKEGAADRTLARAWTLTVLEVLDASSRSRVVRFLYEALLLAYGPLNKKSGKSGVCELKRLCSQRAQLTWNRPERGQPAQCRPERGQPERGRPE